MKHFRSIVQWFKLMLTPTSTLAREAAEARSRMVQADFWAREVTVCGRSTKDAIERGDWREGRRWWIRRNVAVHRYNLEVRKPLGKPLGMPPIPTPSFEEVTK